MKYYNLPRYMDDLLLFSSWCHGVMVIFHSHFNKYMFFWQRKILPRAGWRESHSWPSEDRNSSLRMARFFIYRPGYQLDSWQKHESIEIWNIFMVYSIYRNLEHETLQVVVKLTICFSTTGATHPFVKSGSTWFALHPVSERSTGLIHFFGDMD